MQMMNIHQKEYLSQILHPIKFYIKLEISQRLSNHLGLRPFVYEKFRFRNE